MIEIDGIYQKVVKQSNRRKIFNYLRRKRVVTKLGIARDLDLSITTVSSNIKTLITEGYASASKHDDSTGGRKAQLIEFNPNARFSIGLELKEQVARIVLINLDYEIVNEQNIDAVDHQRIPEKCILIINSFIKEVNVGEKLVGVGLSLPGIVDRKKMLLIKAPNMDVENIDFSSLVDKFTIPITIENEANCAAYAEFCDLNSSDTLCYVSITEGIGGALIVNNRLIKGKHFRAGEFGHVRVRDNGLPCHCGKNGCWEQYASAQALRRIAKDSGYICSLSEFIALYDQDKVVTKAINHYLVDLASGLLHLLLTFDPGRVIIGGSIAKFHKTLKPLLIQEIAAQSSLFSADEISLDFSKMGADAGVVGGAIFSFRNLFE